MKLWIRWLFVDYRYVSHRAMVLRHPPYIGGGNLTTTLLRTLYMLGKYLFNNTCKYIEYSALHTVPAASSINNNT